MSSLILAEQLCKYFPSKNAKKLIKAVDGVSFSIAKGESFGLIGESGCGKSTVGKMLLRLVQPTSGEIYFNGINLCKLNESNFKQLRPKMQPIFQDADTSLDPRFTTYRLLAEPFIIQGVDRPELRDKILKLMKQVNLGLELLERYPHELSGGQRQRIGLARAIALHPEFIVADEPAASLDLSVQAQVLELLKGLQQTMGLSLLYISHNLRIIKVMTGRVAVMYLGKFVEIGETEEVFHQPAHPYTKALLESLPVLNPNARRKKTVIKGEIPDPFNLPTGCLFHPRCLYRNKECEVIEPPLVDLEDGRQVACHCFG